MLTRSNTAASRALLLLRCAICEPVGVCVCVFMFACVCMTTVSGTLHPARCCCSGCVICRQWVSFVAHLCKCESCVGFLFQGRISCLWISVCHVDLRYDLRYTGIYNRSIVNMCRSLLTHVDVWWCSGTQNMSQETYEYEKRPIKETYINMKRDV